MGAYMCIFYFKQPSCSFSLARSPLTVCDCPFVKRVAEPFFFRFPKLNTLRMFYAFRIHVFFFVYLSSRSTLMFYNNWHEHALPCQKTCSTDAAAKPSLCCVVQQNVHARSYSEWISSWHSFFFRRI